MMYGCKRVTSAMRSFLGCSGRTIFRRRGVHMHMLYARVLIFLEEFLMPMNAVGDGVVTYVYYALGGRTAACCGFCFTRTMRPLFLWYPSKRNQNSEGGPPCNSMPFRCSIRCTIRYKCGYLLARHRT